MDGRAHRTPDIIRRFSTHRKGIGNFLFSDSSYFIITASRILNNIIKPYAIIYARYHVGNPRLSNKTSGAIKIRFSTAIIIMIHYDDDTCVYKYMRFDFFPSLSILLRFRFTFHSRRCFCNQPITKSCVFFPHTDFFFLLNVYYNNNNITSVRTLFHGGGVATTLAFFYDDMIVIKKKKKQKNIIV